MPARSVGELRLARCGGVLVLRTTKLVLARVEWILLSGARS
jgi:hypothetical protein